MILLSNVIKSIQMQGSEKEIRQRLLKSKPISTLERSSSQTLVENEQDHEQLVLSYQKQKERLQDEIIALEESYRELQNQMVQAKKEAELEIDEWWQANQKKASEEAVVLAEEAKEQGFQEGYENGYRQIQQELEGKIAETTQLVQLAYEENKKIVQQAEPFLLNLSVKIAEKVIQQELKQHSEQVLSTVQAGLQQVLERGEIVIQVSPDDYPLILSHIEELERYTDSESELRVVPDHAQAGTGGCIIHTPNGSYDVTVDSQLKEITKQLMAYYEESDTDEGTGR